VAALSPDPVRTLVQEKEKQEREKYEESDRVRPLEDPSLVGEEAAERARKERLAKRGNEILLREERRWDWLIGKLFPYHRL
jgi:hypothetical protein